MLWVDKYHPQTESDIVVHPKKVAEIKAWLASHYQQREPPSSSFSTTTTINNINNSRVLLLKGPVGAGKSSTIRVLAAQYGCFITEWKTPQTASWEEAQYQQQQQQQSSSSRGGDGNLSFHSMYHSAVDSFEEFIIRCRMPALTLTHAGGQGGGSGSSKKNQEEDDVIIIDDDTEEERNVFDLTSNDGEAWKANKKNNNNAPSQRRLIMIEDLPFTANAQQQHRVAEALASLARSARFPFVVCCSEATGRETQADRGERGGGNNNNKSSSSEAWHSTSLLKQVEDSFDPSSYSTISLNPLTDNMISKALHRVLMRESLDDVVSGARVQAVAEGAGGDVRSALCTMQFLCTGVAPGVVVVASGGNEDSDDGGGRGKKRKKTKKKTAAAGNGRKKKGGGVVPPTAEEIAAAAAPFAQRDGNLTLFHALGRFLYNKRVSSAAAEVRGGGSSGGTQQLLTPSKQKSVQHKWLATELSTIINPNNALISSQYQRNPTEFDPEAVLTGAGLNASSVSSFLHENYINFIDDGAIEDAAGCCDYLSISDILAFNSSSYGGRRGGGGQLVQDDEVGKSSTLSDASAALTAAMGTCFSNCHPAPRRFLPLKAPASYLVRKATSLNSKLLQGEVDVQWALQTKSGCLESKTVLVSELIPSARLLVSRRAAAAGGGGGGDGGGGDSGGGAPGSSLVDVSRLVPRHWSRVWNGQLYEETPTSTTTNNNGHGIVLQGEEGEMDTHGAGGDEEHGSDGGSSNIEDDSESDW